MKKILVAMAFTALLVGCDSKPDAPFGLTWGQSMESINFIKDGNCETKENITTCKFENQKPFNQWSYSNELTFDKGALVKVISTFAGIDGRNPSFQNFNEKLNIEADFLQKNGFNADLITKIKQNCQNSEACDKTSERFTTPIGNISIWLTTKSTHNPIGVVTFTP
ncbi:hypothetical protein VCB84_000211 [Providencia rettgeri]|uniref:hypothetical protein n=1 Tax=Providencia rettgeri TaxID=587 RepID=UPI0005B302AC|nr:hypothetical protein [Providencia rettgeri]EJD6497475.1 hypothetical protein [Providencia rettgeri]EJD6641067.1 hypothetical protein [Providencia rettgeri]ELL9155877.1 hypothetical protein [Providencia rettgeri]ELR5047279.1 hypothetical protein [Providencia rettgeri]ELR5060895.1 hypothetical protein [Providencia rettgeri]